MMDDGKTTSKELEENRLSKKEHFYESSGKTNDVSGDILFAPDILLNCTSFSSHLFAHFLLSFYFPHPDMHLQVTAWVTRSSWWIRLIHAIDMKGIKFQIIIWMTWKHSYEWHHFVVGSRSGKSELWETSSQVSSSQSLSPVIPVLKLWADMAFRERRTAKIN